MEGKRLEKKLQDWASDLSFTLPDGSAPPTNYFAPLTATPHRRQLWEALIESVQPRQKVEHMRRQIMVAKLKDKKIYSRQCDSAPVADRIELWKKQLMLENQIKEEESEVMKLERIIIAKVSDVFFEISKLAELEKAYEEYSQKALTLRLCTKRERDVIRTLEGILLKGVRAVSYSEYFETCGSKKNVDPMKDELSGAEEYKSAYDDYLDSKLGNKLQALGKSEISEQNKWEEVIKCKKTLLSEFGVFLDELNSDEKNILSEKEVEMEESLSAPMKQLKQKATEKSLQVILNSTEGQALDLEIEKLEERFYEGEPKVSPNGTFSEAISPHAIGGTSDSLSYDGKAGKSVEKYVSAVGLRCYKEFLVDESKRLREEVSRAGEKEDCEKAEREQERSIFFDCIVEEINLRKSEEEAVAKEILGSYDTLVCRVRALREEVEEKEKAKAIEVAEKLKCASERLIDIFMETPLDAFRIVESYSGRLLFECESLSHCLNSYGGELNHFFSAVLIPPQPDPRAILSEVEARRKMSTEVKNVIRRRDQLAQLLRKIQHRMESMTLDTRLCEKNFQESANILRNVSSKSCELLRETDFIESILKNWVEQPYRWMVGQT